MLGLKLNHVSKRGYSYAQSVSMSQNDVGGLMQGCINSIANALELLQSYTKPSVCLIKIFATNIIICQTDVLIMLSIFNVLNHFKEI